MGLDNLPRIYPCRDAAVRDPEGRIDCDATQDAGGCPWKNATDRPTVSAPVGMLGTYCWYRGKYGEHLLRVLGIDDEVTFYGDDEDGTQKSPEACRDTATAMRRALAGLDDTEIVARLTAHDDAGSTPAEFRAQVEYAAWWLDWVADHADGSTCWY